MCSGGIRAVCAECSANVEVECRCGNREGRSANAVGVEMMQWVCGKLTIFLSIHCMGLTCL